MNEGRERFIFKVALLLLGACGALYLLTVSVEQTTTRFGGIGWIPIIIGVLALAAGAIATWATAITWLDRRALRRHRADPESAFREGQTLALSGRIRVAQAPLASPFSGKACAAYRYQVTAQRRNVGPDNDSRQQLCLLGFALAEARLDCGTRSFPIHALPDVDTDLREIATGGDWGDRGLAKIRKLEQERDSVDEPLARATLSDAYRFVRAPQSEDLYVASTRSAGPEIGVIEDAVPIDEPVTVLAAYSARTRGLGARRPGGLKVLAGTFDERLRTLDEECRKGLQIAAPLLGVGLVLLTAAAWWPGPG
ncbi:MAG: hypothetical protein V2J19_00530 [Wenzhouxiangella sp.]|jgi:hypothetical protein|nr:hypothetical protein [Wenzhouxiangella sp.]